MCVDVSAPEALESPGENVPFLLDIILVDLEGGRYVGPILPIHLADLVYRGGSSSGGSSATEKRKNNTSGG